VPDQCRRVKLSRRLSSNLIGGSIDMENKVGNSNGEVANSDLRDEVG